MIHVWYSIAAEANHADADCFVCVFLSHGENDHVYAYDDKIAIQDITALFKGDKCKSLVGKPKIFILQVRGQMMRCLLNRSIWDGNLWHSVLLTHRPRDHIWCLGAGEGISSSDTLLLFVNIYPHNHKYLLLNIYIFYIYNHHHIDVLTVFGSWFDWHRQACRGDKHDDPVTPMDVVDSEVKTNEVVVDAGVVYTLPAGADFIMCYSVAEGEEHMAQLIVHYRKQEEIL